MGQKRLFVISAVCYLISGASVLPMIKGDISGKNGSVLLAVLSGAVFWLSLVIAIAAQLLLRRIQKPYRKKQRITALMLSPPALWFETLFLLGLFFVILFSLLNINGFVFYISLFLTLFGLELGILTSGKFRRKNGKFIFNIYRIQKNAPKE